MSSAAARTWAMRSGVILPPFVLASARYLIAGPIMLALSAIF
jgi:hypothetical protein